jgi:hypothetical protein
MLRIGGACGPPPPFAAPLVPRYALSSGATPRVCAEPRSYGDSHQSGASDIRFGFSAIAACEAHHLYSRESSFGFSAVAGRSPHPWLPREALRLRALLQWANSPLMRGVAAGRSAQRGTSGAATGGGGRAALPRPGDVFAQHVRSAPPTRMPTRRGAELDLIQIQVVGAVSTSRPSCLAKSHTSMFGGSMPSDVSAVQIWLR